jgi:hypothetical protein
MKRYRAWQITKVLDGFSDGDFARDLGCSKPYISLIAAGRRKNTAILESMDARIKAVFRKNGLSVPKIED